ncbi:MAG: hypothetical protein JJ900_01165 [Rhodospirillales bacterium]|nr:hypothetical protein [Rhodospirillales bacterium]MBO6785429.1 hypothetical protein [Rhodospirillales bacterium]
MKRAAISLFLALFIVSACGPLPRPFGRDDGDSGTKLARQIFFEGVEVQPMTGTTKPMSELIADAVIGRLQNTYEIPASYQGMDRSEFVLLGHVVDNQADPGVSEPISVEWQLLRRDGEVLERFVDAVDASRLEWDYGSAPMLEKIGERISTRVAKAVLGERFGTTGQDRLLGRAGVYIGQVTGAPGDGNVSLRRAMAVALGGGGVRLTNNPVEAIFTLSGTVEMGSPENNAQSIRIVWDVKDVDGQVVGTARQSNVVAAGSLDGSWGRTAAFVAAAATEGIIKVVRQNDPNKLRAPNLGAPRPPRDIPQTAPPRTPILKQQPGRAPPPPT